MSAILSAAECVKECGGDRVWRRALSIQYNVRVRGLRISSVYYASSYRGAMAALRHNVTKVADPFDLWAFFFVLSLLETRGQPRCRLPPME